MTKQGIQTAVQNALISPPEGVKVTGENVATTNTIVTSVGGQVQEVNIGTGVRNLLESGRL
jgi:hypothetical protein